MERRGGCACGAVRYVVDGGPLRVGLCHCLTCRKRHGAPCNAFVVFRAGQVRVTGETLAWASSEHGRSHGCAACGSPVFWRQAGADEIELHLGGFDEPGQFSPQYEVWVKRREPWMMPLNVPQYVENRPAAVAS